MGCCTYFVIICALVFLFTYIHPDLERFSFYSPKVVLISPHKGIFSANDPPLYKALMQKLISESEESSANSANPLYSESSYVSSVFNQNKTHLHTILIRNDIRTNIISDPYRGEAAIYNCTVENLLTPKAEIEWNFVWNSSIPGIVNFIGSSYSRDDLTITYRTRVDEGFLWRIRYYYDRLINSYEDFQLPGGADINAISNEADLIVYSRRSDIRVFRTLIRTTQEVPENSTVLYSENGVSWFQIAPREYQDRSNYDISEVVGLHVTLFKDKYYLGRSWVKSQSSFSEAYSMNEFLYLNASDKEWNIFENFYNNVTLSDIMDLSSIDEISSMTNSKISNQGELLFIGHMGRILSYVHWGSDEKPPNLDFISTATMTDFNRLEANWNGTYIALVVPGYHEKHRLRLIRMTWDDRQLLNDGAVDISLDSLPGYLLNNEIRSLKLIDHNEELYAVIFYSEGTVVVLDLNEIIEENGFSESNFSYLWLNSITSLISIGCISCLFLSRGIWRRRVRQN
ncbi:unnamed protein product [Blepharisma stoltei]|uniref:Uncharacterized protein n=1 Tax=Blepharisma stoltei TaxID=1481888 RepID=A0AAU9K8U2_9CILI|nr:unnamed protein product [Blepharisma stoltei]